MTSLDASQEQRAHDLHKKAIIIDTMYPDPRGVIPCGIFEDLYAETVLKTVTEMCQGGRSFHSIFKFIEDQVVSDAKTHETFVSIIRESGITAGSVTQGGIFGDPHFSYEGTVRDIAGWIRRFSRLEDVYVSITKAEDIRTAKKGGKVGILMNFQNSTQIGNDLAQLDFFHDLGVRIIQLTYNIKNVSGDGTATGTLSVSFNCCRLPVWSPW